ncbi:MULTISPECIES: GLPGLI family protein [Chryseobacterium]|uniref:GLPGLI family protein n=1 Tax=Chryseobacterium TaxID=59732 RepID=UPI00162449B1|nr:MULTISPECIES: GLPGLI family protein [Chryseobacterium]MDM1553839.1 GLPGLI family protein [Chryseobacterium indologenes]
MKNKQTILKTAFIVLLLWISSGYFYAQNYQVIYEVKFKPSKENDAFIKENMILRIFKDQSTFYSLNKATIDSLVNQNNFKAASSTESPLLRLKVSKSLSKNSNTVGVTFNQFQYWYNETNLQYKGLKKHENYKGYSTQEAYTDFGQRKWHILYTTDIPINDGPYIFSGLPGLVLKAESEDGDYTFEMTAIKKIENVSVPELHKENIKKEKLSKNINDFIKDPASHRINFSNDFGDSFTYEFKGARDQNYKETNKRIQELIQKFNNYPDKNLPILTF